MERVYEKSIEGKKVMFINYSGLKGKEGIDVARQVITEVDKIGSVLAITNFEGFTFDSEFEKFLKCDDAKRSQSKMAKNAVVGLKGIQKMVYKVYVNLTGASKTMQAFTTESEAIEWIIS